MSFSSDPPELHQGEQDTGKESKAAAERLIRQIERYVHLLHITHDAIICVDDDCQIVIFNQGAEKLFGYQSGDIVGKPLNALLSRQYMHEEAVRLNTLTRLARDNHLGFRADRIICRRLNGEHFPSEVSVSQGNLLGHPLYTLVVRDSTHRHQQERQLAHQAEHDGLTDLPNRILLSDRLEAGIARASRYHRKLGVIYIDLDNFKPINDRYGHETGDCLLQAVAQRLTHAMRQSDTVSRIGGDEFVICLEHIKSPEDASAAAAKVVRALKEPYRIDNKHLEISASLGIAVYPDHGKDPSTLLRCADEAMYRSKAGGGKPQLFSY